MRTLLTVLLLMLFQLTLKSQELKLRLETTPFSRYGSYMAISTLRKETATDSLYVHDLSGSRIWKENHIFLIEPVYQGKPLKYTLDASPTLIKVITDKGLLEICFDSTETIRFRSSGIGFRISNGYYDQASLFYQTYISQYRYLTGTGPHYLFTVIKGSEETTGNRFLTKWDLNEKRDFYLTLNENRFGCELAIQQYQIACTRKEYKPFDKCVKETDAELANWMKSAPKSSAEFETTTRLAWYLTWNSVVSARGLLGGDAVLMSKNHMHGIWSWDHCFNALALAHTKPDLAWEQIKVMFDHQNNNGGLPDLLTDFYKVTCYTKPPIHGWAIGIMMQQSNVLTPVTLKYIYDKLAGQFDFWVKLMDDDNDGIPQYNHGFDSGWDNATVFDIGMPVESPDLATFLVLQADFLESISADAGKKEDKKKWKSEKEKLLQNLIKHSWNGEYFSSKRNDDHFTSSLHYSLVSYYPLLLGKMLPDTIRFKLIKTFKKSELVTGFGLATESPLSSKYESDGYWRGPIWAPATYLMINALRNCGESELARDIAVKFCRMCKVSGFAENFEAITGRNLRCQSYTWTSAVYLLLQEEYQL